MAQKIKKTTAQLRRKYNADYRLRKKLGKKIFPNRSKIVNSSDVEEIIKHSEMNILINEFGFIVKPSIF